MVDTTLIVTQGLGYAMILAHVVLVLYALGLALFPQAQTLKSFTFLAVRYRLHIACLITVAATIGSIALSELAGLAPCSLCWIQRALMYPLAALFLYGVFRKDERVFWYALPFVFFGILVAAYHYLIQFTGVPAVCSIGTGPSCSEKVLLFAGYITIPMMSLTSFVVILLLGTIKRWTKKE